MPCHQRFSVGWTWRVSIPTPFHSISFPPWEEGIVFEWVDRACQTYMYIYMSGFQKTFIIVCLSYRLQASTEVLCTFVTVLLHICTGRGWCRNSRGAEWAWRSRGLGTWRFRGRGRGQGLGLGTSAGGLLAVTVNVSLGCKNASICFASIGGQWLWPLLLSD